MNMVESVTGDSVFAEIIMLRQVDTRSIVLIEGVGDNDTLYAHVDHTSSRLLIAYGKQNLERAVVLAERNGVERVLGIRDRDFLGVLDPQPDSPNIVLTDLYDLDATIVLLTDCIGKALPHLASMPTVETHVCGSPYNAPIDLVLGLVTDISFARFHSHQAGLGLPLAEFPVEKVASQNCHGVVVNRICEIVAGRSNSEVSPDELARALEELRDESPPPAEIASGHDLIRAIAHACRSVWGGTATGYKLVAAVIRSALSCEQLMTLQLYRRVAEWESRTSGRVWSCR